MSYSDSLYKIKYLKYKSKYMSLKQLSGGVNYTRVNPPAPEIYKRYHSSCKQSEDKNHQCKGPKEELKGEQLSVYNSFIKNSNDIRSKGKYDQTDKDALNKEFDKMSNGSAFGTSRNDHLIPFMNQDQLNNFVDAKQVQTCFNDNSREDPTLQVEIKKYCSKK